VFTFCSLAGIVALAVALCALLWRQDAVR